MDLAVFFTSEDLGCSARTGAGSNSLGDLPPGQQSRGTYRRPTPRHPRQIWAPAGKETAPFAASRCPPRCPRPAPCRAAPTRPPEPPSSREPGRGPGDNAAGLRPRAELPCAMAASPAAPPALAVEAPPPQPEARTLEHGSDSRAGQLSFYTKVCYGIGGIPNQVASSATAFYLQLFLLDVAQGAGLHALHHRGLLPPVVPAPLHQPAGPLVHKLLLPVPGAGHGMTMEMAGTLMGAAVHGLIVSGAHRPHRCEDAALAGPVAVSPDAARLYSIAAAVLAMTYPVCSGLLCLGVKERPDSSDPASGQGLSFLAGLRLTVQHPPYLKLVISFLFISAAIQVEQSYLVLFCTHASRLHDHVQGVVLTILVSAVLSTPLWEWVIQRFGKKTSAFGICVMVPFVILLAAVPTAPVAYAVALVSGLSIAVSLLLPWSMLPDVVDAFQQQHQHGPGLETIFYSSYVFFTKLSGACALGISTLSLEFAGYEAGACKQAEQVVVTLKVLIGAVPTCVILTGLCILMVGPTSKVPSGEDPSHRQSLKRDREKACPSRGSGRQREKQTPPEQGARCGTRSHDPGTMT
ncbi:major facilitator superfamily domain-containing protein 2B isoform X3 [Ailuropoda melanoleuca]|uniref:major facilitator superfamily domain-containing protein 2B isoform X3 n=1 Tax=Ailuropoda melanoleuca TaxID=9646 RepID=UPI001494F5C8|nr:major facilitator superfamily domain-containing protein 2B isoform X3 [Ailuropoda melanoleuca]